MHDLQSIIDEAVVRKHNVLARLNGEEPEPICTSTECATRAHRTHKRRRRRRKRR